MKVFSPLLNGTTTTSGSFNVPNHPSTGSIPNPLTGSLFHDDTDGILKVYTGTQWAVVGAQTATSAAGPTNIEYLLIAGGGSGGGGAAGSGGAGGAGGYLSSSLDSVAPGSSFTITVGAGASSTTIAVKGAAGSNSSIAGSSISTITVTGGGEGGYNSSNPGGAGGSGGGGSSNNGSYGTGGSGTVGQGNNGGAGFIASVYGWCGGGGGGAGSAGETAEGNNNGGEGGSGLTSNITGTGVQRAGGGGGGAWTNGGNGTATDGGGNGGAGAGSGGTSGTFNTGGGGGGGGQDGVGGAGGSGVAIFAYSSGSKNGAGGIVGDAGNGKKYHQFNSSGDFAVGSNTDFQLPAKSNLKLHLDAANFNSYPGTGNTWFDISGNSNNFTLDGSGITWNNLGWFDLENGGATKTGGAVTTSTTVTLAFWIKTTDTQALFWSDDNSQFYVGAYSSGNKEYHNECGSPIYYQDLVEKSNIYDNIRTGNWIFVEFKSMNFSLHGSNNYINQYSPFELASTDIGAYYLYDKNLTTAESLQLYNATKHNFV